MNKRCFIVAGAVMLCMTIFSTVNAQSSVKDKEDARAFVQKFYDWYSTVYAKQRHIDAHFVVLKNRPQYLDKKLFEAIVADDRAQATRLREIVGLGYDPFTNTLNKRKGFQTGRIIQKEDKFLIDVHDIGTGESIKTVLASKLVLTAEVTKMNGHFAFSNFIYPNDNGYTENGNNLLGLLDSLHKDRIKQRIEKI